MNGRIFLNNAAMGVCGAIVDSPDYREHKVRTAIAKLTDRLGPATEPFDLRFVDGDGREHGPPTWSWCRTTGTHPSRGRDEERGTGSIEGCWDSSP